MKMKVIGCGDAFGSGGRAHACFFFQREKGSFLIDCGASSLIKMKEYGIDPHGIETVFISHLHGDHFGGLVFLLREATLYGLSRSDLTIAGPPGLAKRLESALEVFFPGGSKAPTSFKLDIIELEPGTTSTVNGIGVRAEPMEHPCGDIPYALRIDADTKTIAYTGDTIWRDPLCDLARDADLLISEAYTYEKPLGYHLTYLTVQERLANVGAKRVILTHMSKEMIDRIPTLAIPSAYDGLELQL